MKRLLFWGILLFVAYAYLLPHSSSRQMAIQLIPTITEPHKPVTFAEVSAKSRDAILTTATFMGQEKERLSAHMAVILGKLDLVITRLQRVLANVSEAERPAFRERLREMQQAREGVLQLQSHLKPAQDQSLEHLKTHWRKMQLDIGDQLSSAETTFESKL